MLPSERWTHSMVLREGSSGGRSLLSYGPHSDLDPSPRTGFRFSEPTTFEGTVSSPSEYLSILVEGEGDIAAKRILSCILVAMMPSEGMNEAFNSLKSMLLFYSEPVVTLRSLPGAGQPGGTGRIGKTTRRPDLAITE